ncbi:MAG: hypothetical protein AAB445_03510 [Patescibacteria group bacterium]
MPEGEYRPSPAEMGAEEPEEQKPESAVDKNKASKKTSLSGKLRNAAKIGAFVAAGLVGGGAVGEGAWNNYSTSMYSASF